MIKILNIIDKYLLLVLVFLYPLFFLPIFQNVFDTGKLLLLTVGVLFLTTIKIIKTILLGNFKFYSSKLDVLIVALSLTYILSSFLSPVGKFDSFVLPGSTSFIILGSFLYFFINQLREKGRSHMENVLIISVFVASLLQIVSFLAIPSLKFMGNNFSSLGNIISSLVFFAILLPISFYKVIQRKDITDKILFGIASFVIFVGLSLSFYSILPKKNISFKLPNLSASWSIAIDNLKENPLLGVGPTNFLSSFNKFRPMSFNATDDWGVKYIVSRNTPLTMMVEVGLLGLAIFLLIFFVSLKTFNISNPIQISIAIFFVVSLFLPISPVIFPILFLLLAIDSETKEVSGIFTSKIPAFVMTIPFIGFVALTSYASFKVFASEYSFNNVIKLLAKNEGLKAYDELVNTISINPYSDRYHLASAEINLAIANSIAKKENVTDEDKNTISELVQQSIVEAKAAVSLNPQKSSNWDNLGNIYSSISSFAKEANSFAIEAYNQAIFLDPINPLLRIKLGGVYYAEGKFEDAIKVFELAVLAKPNFANSHFNLAMAYKGNKQLDKAKEQMDIVLKLVDPNSKDYELAKKELDAMGIKTEVVPETDSTPQVESLTPPQTPSPTMEPQIVIPTE